MIPFDFDYILPETLEEARDAWRTEKEAGRNAVYYGGGTEIVTLSRSGTIAPQSVIDLKGVAECRFLGEGGEQLVFGAASSLTRVVESNLFPLLSGVCRGIADRTVRNRLTLGGNVCGRLPYREALLPFLCAKGAARLFGEGGLREVPLSEIFDRRILLDEGEYLVALTVKKEQARLPFASCRKVRGGRVDYPVCAVAGTADGDVARLAISGAWDFPVSVECTRFTPPEKILEEAARPVKEDALAGADYRRTLLLRALESVLLTLEVMPE